MKTYIERTLKQIQDISEQKDLFLSCDIYYDGSACARGKEFVVKVHSSITNISAHFRSHHIRESLKMALKCVKGL